MLEAFRDLLKPSTLFGMPTSVWQMPLKPKLLALANCESIKSRLTTQPYTQNEHSELLCREAEHERTLDGCSAVRAFPNFAWNFHCSSKGQSTEFIEIILLMSLSIVVVDLWTTTRKTAMTKNWVRNRMLNPINGCGSLNRSLPTGRVIDRQSWHSQVDRYRRAFDGKGVVEK